MRTAFRTDLPTPLRGELLTTVHHNADAYCESQSTATCSECTDVDGHAKVDIASLLKVPGEWLAH